MNKRGQGLSTNAIILIVLGIIVLVVLILGFTVGWKSLLPWISTDNVDSVVTQCGIACSGEKLYEFCSKERVLKADNLPKEGLAGNCTYFAETQPIYGIEECPAIDCSPAE